MKKSAVRALMMAGVVAGAVLVSAAPASAAIGDYVCSFPEGATSCTTPYVGETSTIRVTVLGTSGGKAVTCYAYGKSGFRVGPITNSNPSAPTTTTASVPKDSYLLSCNRFATTGGGYGRIAGF